MNKASPRRGKDIFRYFLTVLLGLLVGFNVYCMYSRILGNPMPMPFGVGMATVQSGSMEPFFHKGDLLIIREDSNYTEGDIVVYPSGSMLVVHRIIGINGDTVTTRGDANNVADAPFKREQIFGSVFARIPLVGIAIDFIKTPLGLILLLGCAVLFSGLSFIGERRAAEEQKKALQLQLLREELEEIKRSSNHEQ